MEQETKTGYLLVACLSAEGMKIETHEAQYFICDNCDKIHMMWKEGLFPQLADCDPKNIGKAYIHDTTFERLKARLIQLDTPNEKIAAIEFRAAFAQWLERIDKSISELTKALL